MSPEDLALAIEIAVHDTYDDYAAMANRGSLLTWAREAADYALLRRLEPLLGAATERHLRLQPWRPTTATRQGELLL